MRKDFMSAVDKDRGFPIIPSLTIETRAGCTRRCPECIRNSYPDREAILSWFSSRELPTSVIERIMREASAEGFISYCCLQYFNEPLLDSRLPELAAMAKNFGFHHVYCCTNADLMNKSLANALDGVMDSLVVSLYDLRGIDEINRKDSLNSMFSKTKLTFTDGEHFPVHFSPTSDVDAMAKSGQELACFEPRKRLIINHLGTMVMCCDDLVGEFKLGNVFDNSIAELWYSPRHMNLINALGVPGGRACHPYCMSCPRIAILGN